jgi:predicted RNase H-like HicB family nuclease
MKALQELVRRTAERLEIEEEQAAQLLEKVLLSYNATALLQHEAELLHVAGSRQYEHNYPAIFSYLANGLVMVEMPDMEKIGSSGVTSGYSKEEALYMAQDLLGLIISDALMEGGVLPEPTPLEEVQLTALPLETMRESEEEAGYEIVKQERHMIGFNSDSLIDWDVLNKERQQYGLEEYDEDDEDDAGK